MSRFEELAKQSLIMDQDRKLTCNLGKEYCVKTQIAVTKPYKQQSIQLIAFILIHKETSLLFLLALKDLHSLHW